MDWDNLRIFYAAAQAGSFTHAGDVLRMSQSAVSRHVNALEAELGVTLFHRHARGLLLTEPGELLSQTAREVFVKLDDARARLVDSRQKPEGVLRVTTTIGLGSSWLSARIHEFCDLYPDIELRLIFSDNDLDLAMREADIAIWLHLPAQGELVQRRLFTVHFHLYAAPAYLKRFGTPQSLEDLDSHRLISFGDNVPPHLRHINWLESAGLGAGKEKRRCHLQINNLIAIRRAVQRGAGIAFLPDYLTEENSGLVQVLPSTSLPSFESYLVYSPENRKITRVNAFRDFLVNCAHRWEY